MSFSPHIGLDLPDPAEWSDFYAAWNAAHAAAKLGLNPDGGFWSWSDVEECAAHIFTAMAETADTVTAPVKLRTLTAATHAVRPTKYNRAPKRAVLDPLTGEAPYYPAARVTVSRFMGDVTNWREREENRKRGEIAADGARSRRESFRSVELESDESRRDRLAGTAIGARRAAVDMLAALGLPTEWGPHFTAAYTAARSADGLDRTDIAAELDMSPAAYRKHLSRAAGDHSYPVTARRAADPAGRMFRRELKDSSGRPVKLAVRWDRSAYAAALAVPDGGVAYGVHAVELETPDRVRPDREAPVTVRTVDPAPSTSPAAWTATCSPRYADRMRAAAARRDERAAARAAAAARELS